MRFPRRHSLNSQELKRALQRAAIDTLNNDRHLTVLPRPGGGSSAFKTSSTDPELNAGDGADFLENITIRTSQNQRLAFARDKTDQFWKGLEATFWTVIVSSVDSIWDPKHAHIHKFEKDEVRRRLDKAYAARNKVGKFTKPGTPITIALYDREGKDPELDFVGAGIGIEFPPIATVPLSKYMSLAPKKRKSTDLRIPEARRRLAATYGVPTSAVTITIDRKAKKKTET
jgi:hypothetical protein